MTAPRAREQADPPSPPERRPPRRGGGSSPYTYAASAAAALLALTGALAVPQSADAQTVATLVSNTGETVGSEVASKAAQPFTTGSAAVLASVDIRLGSSSLAGPPRVRILQDDSGSPGAELVTLVNPSSIVNEAVNNFTAPANTTLLADTTYYVELTRAFTDLDETVFTSGRRYRVTGSDDQTGLTNWNIGDSRYFKSSSDVSWNTSSSVMMIAIKGTVVADTPTLSIADAAGDEGGNVTFTWTLSPAAAATVTATWTASIETGDTAVAADLGTTTTGMVSVSMGTTTGTFTVSTAEDSLDEDDETFTVTLSNVSSNAQLAADPTARGTITDDDNLPELAIGLGGTEEANTPVLSVSVTPASGREVMVTWTATIESDDTAEAADFTDLSTATGTVTIPAGQSSHLLFLRGVVADDSLDEDDETFTVTLSSPVNATLSLIKAGRVTIQDDDDPPTVTVADGTASEGNKVEFVVTLSAESGRDVEVDYATSVGTGQTATSGTDFTAASSTLTIEEGDETGTIEVQTTEDSTEEEDETFTLTISDPANATLGTKTAAKGTIEDDDGTKPTLSIADGSETEGALFVFTVRLSEPASADVTVICTASFETGDTAVAGDLTFTSANGTIQSGQNRGVCAFRSVQDSTDEEDETFTVTLSSPSSNAQLASDPTAKGTINDDDDPPTVSVADVAAAEGEDLVFTVALSAASGKTVTVAVATSVETGDTATSGTDFTAVASTTLTFDAGQEDKTVTVQTTEDATEEEDETFTLTISDPANATLGTKTAAKGTINDDDGTLTPTNCTLNTGDVWCGTVTVGTETSGTTTTGHGFSSDGSFGTLTDNSGNQTFTYGTQTYVVSRVVVGVGVFAGELAFRVQRSKPENFVLDDDHRAKLALHVAGSTTPFAFRDTTGYNATLGYLWSNSGLDWSSASAPTVRLRELPDAPTGFEAAVGNAQVGLTWDAPASGANITRHEFRYKTVGSYPTTWTAIATSAPGGTNEASFTVTGLTNEIAHTFELRAVNDSGGGAAVEDGPVTPTPGICGRTAKIQEVILAELAGVTDCAVVTVANLASITTFGTNGFGTFDQGITPLQAGDFGGLTGLTLLKLNRNQLTSLPEGIFSGLTAITEISLNENQLTSLPEGTFAGLPNLLSISLSGNNFTQIPGGELSGVTTLTYLELTANKITELPAGLFTSLTALDSLYLGGNDLETLDAGVFSRLSALEVLNLNGNELESLPDGLLSALSALESLELKDNDLNSLDAGVFSGLSALEVLKLSGNELESLPDGLLSGLSALDTLELHGNTVDPLPLTVTVEKVGTDEVRAEVAAGAPFAVDFTPTVVNGSLAASDTKLAVAAGSVEGTAETVTRTTGAMAAVTVDIDLTSQPSLPTNHTGYEFVKATSGLPATILPDTRGPQNFTAAPGDGQAVLSWTAPASGSGVTKHQYRQKEGTGSYPANWTDIPNSAEGGANEDGYTVPDLTNETVYTFELRSVVGTTEGAASESDPVTPTPGICGRTAKIQEVILAELADVSECAAVTVANLASITTFGGALGLATFGQGITSLEAGDFGGLTALTKLNLGVNDLTTLPAGIFSGLAAIEDILLNGNELTALPEGTFAGLTTLAVIDLASNSFTAIPARTFEDLTALTELDLSGNDLTALPDGLFSGLSALESLSLSGNDLTALPAGLFSGLSALSTLTLYENDLVSLPAGLFSGLTALDTLDLEDNDLTALPDRLFNGLTALESLRLEGNDLTALPDGLLSGLTKLRVLTLGDNPNTGDTLALTVTVEKVGTDQARAKVLAGAPAAVEFTPTVANGALAGGASTTLGVAAGEVDGTAVTVTRTTGTMAAVTVDIDLSTQPSLASGFTGFTFAKATSGLPAVILPDTRSPQNFTAKPGDGQAVLSWTAPASASGVTRHDYRYKSGTGSYPATWTDIPNSAAGEANEDGYTVPNLTNETVYTFELRSVVGTTEGTASESDPVTPTPGICDRTQQVRDGILAKLADVDECEAVTVANLAGIGRLDLDDKGITSLKVDDFTGLTGMTTLILNDNDLTSLPAGVFSGLTALSSLFLVGNDLSSLPANVFSGLTSLGNINLRDNDLSSLPANVFSGLTSLWDISLRDNDLSSLPATVFSGLTSLINIDLLNNDLTSLPDGLFSGLTGLENLVLGANPNSGDELPLTVTLEKVGEDRVRAKVPTGAPFAVAIPVTPANGTLAGGVTMLTVAAGSVESAAVTVTRTEGTTAAVTVDVDLTNQPSLPPFHLGYFFARAPSGLPAVILPEEASLEPPTALRATPGDRQAVLAWTPPAPDSGFTRHQYRYRTDGDFGDWTDIPDSGPGGANATRYTVTGLANAVEHTFELRARDAGAGKSDPATVKVTPAGPPRIVGVEVTSGPGLDNGTTYGVGEEIRIAVTFDQSVEVTGDPELALDVGGPRLAGMESGGGTDTLVFVYVVTADDRDADGIEVGGDAIRLDGASIGNGAGDAADLAHDGPGAQPGHRVDGARRAGVHTHAAFTHGHSVFNNGKRFYTQEYPSHTHEGHEHPDKANGHRRRPGTHIHHAPEDPNAFVSGGPGVRRHDGVDHMHRCFDVNPRCNKGDAFTSGTPGLPIEVTHDHANAEPGHGYDWRGEYFEEEPPAPTGVTATPGAGRARLSWEAPALEWDPKALAWVVPAPGLPAHVTHHEYRWTTDGADVGWTAIPDSALFGGNRAGFTVTGLADGKTYTFELRAANAGGGGPPVRAENVTTATVPEIEGVEVASTPDRNDTYGAGDGIRIEVTFDQAVEVEGDPEFGLSVGGERVAMYRWGSGTEVLVFVYTVRPEDRDRDGIWIGAHDHAENPTFRLDGDDRIRNAAGQDADLSHDAPGRLRDHKVNGGGESPGRDEHSHQEFTHSHGHSRGAFAQVFAQHGHAYHVHDDTDGGHSSAMRPGQHVHHVQESLSGDFGPDLRGHGGVEHTHWCGDIEPDCNPDRETVQVADELGLPIRVTHAHTDSEPGHRFGWRGYFGEAGSDPLLSVMGAEATEGDDGALDFTVRLDREPRSEVTVRYATEDGDATAGSDYTATRGTLRFAPGETAKTVRVPILDDTVQDDGETLTLALSNASGAGIWSQAATATGTIHNREEREGPAPLTARFVDMPPGHDGESVFRFRVAFSADIGISYRSLREDAFEVAGGRVTRGRRVDDRRDLFEMTVEPDGGGEVTVTLPAGRECAVSGAICTKGENRRQLTNTPAATVAGPEVETAGPALTARFENMPAAHDGEGAFTFRVAFSENIGISYRSLREDAFTVTGGRVTRGNRVDDRRDLFEMTVEPDGGSAVTVTLSAGRECSVSGAICTKGENRRQLTNTPTATVAGPEVETAGPALTASFVDMPSEHDGKAFRLGLAFSEEIRMSGRRLRSDAVAVSGGRATKAAPVNGRKDLWKLTVRPDSLAAVTVTLAAGAACDSPGAVCTADGRALSSTVSTTVRGPVALSVADARAREGKDPTLDFAVSLSRASSGRVTVDYATVDGSAKAGADYEATSGTLSFAPGETAKTVAVAVLDDAHDEGTEVLVLRLENARGARLGDRLAVGRIENTDHMPAAWLARFGRTVTDQVLDAVEARLAAPRAAGARVRLAGQALPFRDGAGDRAKAAANDNAGAGDNASGRAFRADARDREAVAAIRDWLAQAGTDGPGSGSGADDWRAWDGNPQRADRVRSRALTGRDFVTGTSFELTGGSAEAGGYAALWGRGAISRFDGREGDLTLDGEVTTGLVGADWASAPGAGSGAGRWTAGLAVGHARGTGSYSEGGNCTGNDGNDGDGNDGDGDGSDGHGSNPGPSGCSGEVESTLTGLWPYAGFRLTDRLSAWATAGYGAGELTLTPGGETDGPFTADLTMTMGAAGLRGEVLAPPPGGGLALAVKGDTRFTRTQSKATRDANGGRLEAATGDVWLLRLGVEGSRRFALGAEDAGATLTPRFEVGARLDGGDAETGAGADVGAGVALAVPRYGLMLVLNARGLLAHEASGFRESGASASFTWDPRPGTDRGLALTLRQSWGGSPAGGMEALLGRGTLAGLAADDNAGTASAGRLEAELGYGIPAFGGALAATPYLRFGLTDTGRDYRLGWRLKSARKGGPGFEIGLEATRREAANADVEHGVMLRGTIRW